MFEVGAELAGGIANCPGCGKAVDVPGLNDPIWRVLQGVALLGVVAVTVLVSRSSGVPTGLAWGVGLGILIWLISRAL